MSWWLAGGISASDCAEAYQVRGAGNFTTSLVNLNSPGTNDAILGTSPAFDDNKGWLMSGAQYIIAPAVIQNGWSVFIQYANLAPSANAALIGAQDSIDLPRGAFTIIELGNSMLVISGDATGGTLNSPAIRTGNYGFAGKQPYRNGIAEPFPDSPGNGTGRALYIGAQNTDNVATNFSTVEIRAVAVYNVTITGTQALALATQMAMLGPSFRGHASISDQERQMSSIGDRRIHRVPVGDILSTNAQVGAGTFHSVSTFDHHGGVS